MQTRVIYTRQVKVKCQLFFFPINKAEAHLSQVAAAQIHPTTINEESKSSLSSAPSLMYILVFKMLLHLTDQNCAAITANHFVTECSLLATNSLFLNAAINWATPPANVCLTQVLHAMHQTRKGACSYDNSYL